MNFVSRRVLRWVLRIAGWMVWQAIVVLWALVIFANIFGEYGRLGSNRFVDPIAALAFLAAALWLGTWIPVQAWRRADRKADDEELA
jgi:hypothetical protein